MASFICAHIFAVCLVFAGATASSDAQHGQTCVEAVDGSATCASKGAAMMQLSALDLSAAEAEFKIQEKQLVEGTKGAVNEQEENLETDAHVEEPSSRSTVHPHAAVGAAMMQLSALDLNAAEAELKIQEKQLLEGIKGTVNEQEEHLEKDTDVEELTSRSTVHRHAAVGATMMQLSALDLNAAEAELKIQEKQLLEGSQRAVIGQEKHVENDAEEPTSRSSVHRHAAVGATMMQLSALDLNAAEAEVKIQEELEASTGKALLVETKRHSEKDFVADELISLSTVHRHAAAGAAMMQLSALDLNAAEAELKIQEKELLEGAQPEGSIDEQEDHGKRMRSPSSIHTGSEVDQRRRLSDSK